MTDFLFVLLFISLSAIGYLMYLYFTLKTKNEGASQEAEKARSLQEQMRSLQEQLRSTQQQNKDLLAKSQSAVDQERMFKEQQLVFQQQQTAFQQQQLVNQKIYDDLQQQNKELLEKYQLATNQERILKEQQLAFEQQQATARKAYDELQQHYQSHLNTMQTSHQQQLEVTVNEQRQLVVAEMTAQMETWKTQLVNQAQQQFRKWQETSLTNMKEEQKSLAFQEANNQLEKWKMDTEVSIRQNASMRSQAVIIGKVTEHFSPYLPEFSFNPKDARFIGSPIDFIVFDGMDEGEVKQIVFVEIKTGVSGLSKRERQIKEAILAKQVEWKELKLSVNQEKVAQA